MKPLEILSVAWEGLLTNKLRTLLTMLGVIIGVAAVIMMLAVSAGAQAIVANQIKGLGTNLIFVTPNFTRGGPGGGGGDTFLTMDDVSAIEAQVPGVTGVSTERDANETVRSGGITLSGVSIVGTTADYPTVRSVDIASGRFFTAEEADQGTKVAVLGPTLAESLFGTTNPIGQTILVGNAQLTVIGVTASKGTVGNVDYDSQLYTSLTVVNQRFLPSRLSRIFGSRVTTIFIKVADGTSMDQAIFQTQVLLAKAHSVSLTELPFNVQTQQDVIQTQTATTAAFRALLAWVAAVSLLVGGIGIMNIMLVSVTERTARDWHPPGNRSHPDRRPPAVPHRGPLAQPRRWCLGRTWRRGRGVGPGPLRQLPDSHCSVVDSAGVCLGGGGGHRLWVFPRQQCRQAGSHSGAALRIGAAHP